MIYADFFKNKKVLVTGGGGFIGSNLCEKLLEMGSSVICLDNFSTGHKKNIEKLKKNKRFKLIIGDIRNLKTCLHASYGVDFILHQAALGSVPRSVKDPITSSEVNISGFLNMLVAARDNNVKRFIFAASSSTYGDSESLPKFEDKIGRPLSPYAITKYVNELYAEIFNKVYGLNYIALRYFNVFGKKQDPDGAYAAVIPIFIKNLINEKSPIINGDGSYSRDFTFIDNVVQINLLAMTVKNDKALNQVYNVACGENNSLLELFNTIKKILLKHNPNIKDIYPKHGPIREGDIPHSLASIKKAKELLNYKPTHDLEMGLKETIKYYLKIK